MSSLNEILSKIRCPQDVDKLLAKELKEILKSKQKPHSYNKPRLVSLVKTLLFNIPSTNNMNNRSNYQSFNNRKQKSKKKCNSNLNNKYNSFIDGLEEDIIRGISKPGSFDRAVGIHSIFKQLSDLGLFNN